MKQETSYEEILQKLQNNEEELFTEFYIKAAYLLSDISPAQLGALTDVWEKISISRRHHLMSRLIEALEDDVLLSYDDLARTFLDDEDAAIRTASLKLLQDYDSEDLIPVFLAIAENDTEIEPRESAIALLAGFIYYGELEEISAEAHKKVTNLLINIARDEKNTLLRRRAVEALGFSSHKEVVELIRNAWAQDATDWKISAIFAMGRSYNEMWEAQVLEALKSDDEMLRFTATRAAGELALASARIILLDALKEESESAVLDAAIWSLSQIGGEDVREHLLALLDQYDEEDEEEQIEYIESALENLDFTEDVQKFDMGDFDFDEDDFS